MANSVYDPEQPTDDNSPGSGTLHKNPAQPPKDSGSQEDLRNAESSGDGFYNPQGDGSSTGSSATTGGLAAAEGGSATGTAGGFNFNPKDSTGSGGVNNMIKVAAKHKKGIGVGVGVGGGLVGIALTVFFLLVPLKIEHIVKNLENRFYSSSNDAVGTETQNLLERYITTKVLPAYKSCGTTVSKDCTPKNFGNGPVGNLYRTWANARLENKLAENYGIEFKYDSASKNWYLKAPGSNPGGDNIGPNGEGLSTDFQRSSRSEMRNAINDAMQSETRWKDVMVRYQVGRLLAEKYGIQRCIMFCGVRDQLADKKDAKKIAAQLYITQRVITPRTQTLGIVMECLLNPSCNPEQTQSTPVQDGVDGAPIEAENPDTDTKARQAAQTLAQTFTGASADELATEYSAASEKGFQKYLLEKVLEKAGLGAISSQVTDAIPIANIVLQASNAISFANRAGPAVQKLGYITNASAAASMFMMYRTYADEIHTGNVDPTELGSMVTSLGAGNNGSPSDPEKGGTASAEQTPLYQNIVDGSSQQSVSVINTVLPGKAYADSPANSNASYTCENGKPVPSGKLVCNEEVLGQSNSQLDSAHQFLSSPYIQPVTSVANAISGAGNAIGSVFSNILSSIPFLGSAINSVGQMVSSVLKPFFQDVINVLIPSPFGTNMSGGRKFDMMAAGGDVAGNDYAQTGLGGQKLNNQQLADIVNKQQSQSQQSFSHLSLFARIFSTDSQYSLVSKVAMSMPIGAQASAQSGMASLLNPLGAISHGFGSILSGKVNAAATAQPDPFGVVQYGYPDGTIPNDPQQYWDKHCSDNSAQAYQNDTDFHGAAGGQGWVGAAAQGTPDPNTGMPVNTATNACLLIKATVGSAGGLFDTSNLTQFDLADQQQSAGGAAPTTPAGGNSQQLAQQILQQAQAGKIKFAVVNPANSSDGSTAEDNIKETAAGNPAKTSTSCLGGGTLAPNRTTNLSTALLQFIVDLSNTTTFTINELAGGCHAPTSNHYVGKAVDFRCPFDPAPADAAGKKNNIFDGTGETCSNAGHYHYSIGGN